MKRYFTYMGMNVDRRWLPAQAEILEALSRDCSEQALKPIMRVHEAEYGCSMNWHYPLMEGDDAEALLIPVQEGFLWLPCHTVEHGKRWFSPAEAELLDVSGLETLQIELMAYVSNLLYVMDEMKAALQADMKKGSD